MPRRLASFCSLSLCTIPAQLRRCERRMSSINPSRRPSSLGYQADMIVYAGVAGFPQFEKGTTTFAFKYGGGVIVAADHSDKSSVNNVVQLSSHMLATISGGHEFLLHHLQNKCQLVTKPKITEAMEWLLEILSPYREKALPIGILIAAWDEKDEEECGVYRIDGEGEVLKKSVLPIAAVKGRDEITAFSTGSGSTMATTVFSDVMLDHGHSRISTTEAADAAKEAICIANFYAPEGGDFVTVYHIGSEGCRKIYDADDTFEWQEETLSIPRCKFVVVEKSTPKD